MCQSSFVAGFNNATEALWATGWSMSMVTSGAQGTGAVVIAAPTNGDVVAGNNLFDSAGGEPLAIRLSDPTPWKKFTVYRRVPASGAINVTLAMTGLGTVYFDDIRIEPLVPPNGVATDNNGQR